MPDKECRQFRYPVAGERRCPQDIAVVGAERGVDGDVARRALLDQLPALQGRGVAIAQATMPGQIRQGFRLSAGFDVGRRRYQHTAGRRQLAGYQTGIRERCDPDGDVDALPSSGR